MAFSANLFERAGVHPVPFRAKREEKKPVEETSVAPFDLGQNFINASTGGEGLNQHSDLIIFAEQAGKRGEQRANIVNTDYRSMLRRALGTLIPNPSVSPLNDSSWQCSQRLNPFSGDFRNKVERSDKVE
jgi:hypothetical protein